MALNVTIGGSGTLFIGESKLLKIEVLDKDSKPVDMSGWALLFDVRKKDASPDPAILSKTPTVSGTYNADRTLNQQRVLVPLTHTDLNKFKEIVYRYSLKRTDTGNDTVLAWGNFAPQKATAP